MKTQQDFLNDAFQDAISVAGRTAALGFVLQGVLLRALKEKGVFSQAEAESLVEEAFTSCPPEIAEAGQEMQPIVLALLREPSGR